MIITRDDILRAIARERLIAGECWVGYDEDNAACPVCAVGAVLRGIGLSNQEIKERASEITKGEYIASQSIPLALSHENYIGALSIKWERICEQALPSEWWRWDSEDLEKFKPVLKEWVLQNLPQGVIFNDELS